MWPRKLSSVLYSSCPIFDKFALQQLLSTFHYPHFQSVWINLACCYFYLGMYRSSFRAKFPDDCNEIFLVCFLSALQWCREDDREGGEVEAEDKTPISFVTQVGHHHHWETWLQHDQIRKYLKSAIFCRFGDEKKLMQFHQELEDVIEDQLSLGRK